MSADRIPKRRGRGGRVVLTLFVLLFLGAGGYYGWRHVHAIPAEKQAAQRRSRPPAPVPVTLASVETADFPVTISGLGTVQAFNTVAVRTRVDGQIEAIDFREGQFVKQGDVLARIDPRPYQAALDQAKAKKTQDEASLENARRDLARYQALGPYATRQQTETQGATVAQLTAQVASDQAAIDNAQTQLGYATIRAPIAGLTGFRQVDLGNIVNAAGQTPIVTITQIEPIAVVYTAPEEQLQAISRALARGPVPVTAFSSEGHEKLSEGVLQLVNNQVDTASGTIRLKAVFENKDRVLWPGLSVTTETLVKTLPDAVTIPDDAVQHGPNGLYAYVVDETGKAHMQPITVAQSGGGRSVVSEGLSRGQRVITQGQYRVQPGATVTQARQTAQQPSEEGR